MGRNKKKLNKEKKMSNSDWVQKMVHLELMIRDQHFDRAINYFHEDFVNYGFIEAHNIKGKDGLMTFWKENPGINKQIQWEEPFMEGNVLVRHGIFEIYKFECRVHFKDNKLHACYNKILESEEQDWVQWMLDLEKMLKEQNFDRAINYFHKDYKNHAFIEEHNINGLEELKAYWKKNPEIMNQLK